MTILGIGVDLVHVPRIAALLVRRNPHRFAFRILSSQELTSWKSLDYGNAAQFLAVRWSVKEAFYKASYPCVKPSWKELTYQSFSEDFEKSKPTLEYHPLDVNNSQKLGRIHVSVSHDGEYVYSSDLPLDASIQLSSDVINTLSTQMFRTRAFTVPYSGVSSLVLVAGKRLLTLGMRLTASGRLQRHH